MASCHPSSPSFPRESHRNMGVVVISFSPSRRMRDRTWVGWLVGIHFPPGISHLTQHNHLTHSCSFLHSSLLFSSLFLFVLWINLRFSEHLGHTESVCMLPALSRGLPAHCKVKVHPPSLQDLRENPRNPGPISNLPAVQSA